MIDWLSGVFSYIEKIWQSFYCFLSHFYPRVLDILVGFYHELVIFMLGLLTVIPAPAAIMNFSYGPIPQVFAWAIHDLGLRDGLLIIAAGATIKLTKQTLALVAK